MVYTIPIISISAKGALLFQKRPTYVDNRVIQIAHLRIKHRIKRSLHLFYLLRPDSIFFMELPDHNYLLLKRNFIFGRDITGVAETDYEGHKPPAEAETHRLIYSIEERNGDGSVPITEILGKYKAP